MPYTLSLPPSPPPFLGSCCSTSCIIPQVHIPSECPCLPLHLPSHSPASPPPRPHFTHIRRFFLFSHLNNSLAVFFFHPLAILSYFMVIHFYQIIFSHPASHSLTYCLSGSFSSPFLKHHNLPPSLISFSMILSPKFTSFFSNLTPPCPSTYTASDSHIKARK